jgi:thymidylate synthase (FAD)
MPSKLIAWTDYDADATEFLTGAEAEIRDGHSAGEELVEFAGRVCYGSFNKPNPATNTNAKYIANIKSLAHTSVFEHGTLTFLFTKVSRSLTHELIRHRHFSYSQLSQRFVVPKEGDEPVRHVTMDDEEFTMLMDAYAHAVVSYDRLLAHLTARGILAKKAKEVAREVLPNATPTNIVVTGNYIAWRHFFNVRGSEHADAAIRKEAVEAFEQAAHQSPNVFADMVVYILEDGSKAIHTHLHRAY